MALWVEMKAGSSSTSYHHKKKKKKVHAGENTFILLPIKTELDCEKQKQTKSPPPAQTPSSPWLCF